MKLELTVDDVRSMIGGYVLELIGKDKEIAQLKKEIEALKSDKANATVPHHQIRAVEEKAQ